MSFAWLQIAIDSSRILIKPQNADFRFTIFQNSETYDQGRGGFPTPEGDFFTSGQEAYIMLAQCATDIP